MDITQANETLRQIGRMTLAAISGGRRHLDFEGRIVLKVGNGYSVRIILDEASDTYTVQRVFTRGTREWVKGEVTHVYCDEVDERAYEASSFRSYDFPKGVTA